MKCSGNISVSLNSVLVLCLQIENSPHEFALYIIHVSGGKPDIIVGSFHFYLSSVYMGETAYLGVTGFITGICPCTHCRNTVQHFCFSGTPQICVPL